MTTVKTNETKSTAKSNMATSFEKISQLKDQIKKELDGAKTELAKQLDKAAGLVTQLKEVDPSFQIGKDPQFGQALDELGLVAKGTKSIGDQINKASGKSRNTGEQYETAILKVLEGGKKLGASEITAAITPLLPNKVGVIALQLDALIKDKKISDEGERKSRKYFIKK